MIAKCSNKEVNSLLQILVVDVLISNFGHVGQHIGELLRIDGGTHTNAPEQVANPVVDLADSEPDLASHCNTKLEQTNQVVRDI